MNGTTTASSNGAGDRPSTETTQASPSGRVRPPGHQSPRPKSAYHTIIALSLVRQRLGPIDPRHVEGYMRLQYSTLDGIDADTFDREVALGAAATTAAPADAELLARSYGL